MGAICARCDGPTSWFVTLVGGVVLSEGPKNGQTVATVLLETTFILILLLVFLVQLQLKIQQHLLTARLECRPLENSGF